MTCPEPTSEVSAEALSPELDEAKGRWPKAGRAPVSAFEFWPTWLMYLPVAGLWLANGLRYRSFTLPLIANPRLPVSAMVGVPKSLLMGQAQGACREAILPWQVFTTSEDPAPRQADQWLHALSGSPISLPFVCKPDIGCRGAGVKLINEAAELAAVIAAYPAGTALLCQQLARSEPEAGIFFVRMPGEERGRVTSLTFKASPVVCGDGCATLGELVAADERARLLLERYRERHAERWHEVLGPGETLRLVFSASHCRGAVFRNANHLINARLEARINELMAGLPEFHYGRLDVKYPDLDALRAGRGLEIIEINGASAESIHIWDADTRLSEAIGTLLWQYNTLFRIGALNRRRGHRPPGIRRFVRHLRIERRLARYYPGTD